MAIDRRRRMPPDSTPALVSNPSPETIAHVRTVRSGQDSQDSQVSQVRSMQVNAGENRSTRCV